MSDDDLTRRIHGVGSLAEPVRRDLYLFVAGQPEPVSRDAAAAGVGVARHVAKFHLDRLVDAGLLEAQFQRLTGRTGPGAGRPAKLYRRAERDVSVSLPARQYELAGELMASAIDASVADGVPVRRALDEAAARHGREVAARAASSRRGAERDAQGPGREAVQDHASHDHASHVGATREVRQAARDAPDGDRGPLIDRLCATLAEQGYEPAVHGEEVVLRSCPFHALVAEHTALVCGMNLALLGALGDALGEGALTARLEPCPGRCCVVLGPA